MAKSMVFVALLSLVLLIQNIDASNEFVVESTTCNQWNERSRLQVGDTVVFTYEAEKSLVVKIKHEDYIICNAPSPVNAKKYSHGYSVIKLNQTGSHYFISGIIEINDDKIIVQVIADKRLTTPTPTPTPDPTPSCRSEIIGICVMSGIMIFSVCFSLLVLRVMACMEENQQVQIIRMVIRFVEDVRSRLLELCSD